MDLVSAPIIFSVVGWRRPVNWVKRQKINLCSPASSNQDRALSACTWRLQTSASQTFASRKFNVFIDLFVAQAHLGSLGHNEWKLHSPRAGALLLQQYTLDTHKNQLTDGRALRRRLLLELPIQERWNIDGDAHGFLFQVEQDHKA